MHAASPITPHAIPGILVITIGWDYAFPYTGQLAKFYRDQRKLRGISQTAVSQEISLHQDTVSKFEIKPD